LHPFREAVTIVGAIHLARGRRGNSDPGSPPQHEREHMNEIHETPRTGYRPSGKVKWVRFVAGALVTAAVAGLMAVCLFWAFRRGIYLIFVAPLIASAVVGGVWFLALTWSHCRNKRLTAATSILLALLTYLGYYQLGLTQIIGIRNIHRIDILPHYVQFRMKTDLAEDVRFRNVNRGRRAGPDRVQQGFNWVFFGSELVLVAGVVATIGQYCASRAYCESCSRWMTSETLKLAPMTGAALWDSLEEQQYEDVHALLARTSTPNSVGCNVTVEHCSTCAASERPQVVYLTVKDVRVPGTREPFATKLGALFKPRWSAGQRSLVNQVELHPAEVGALVASFPGLRGTVREHPRLFADARAVAQEIADAQKTEAAEWNQRLARITPVEPEDAGTVLTRRNAIIQTVIGVVTIFGGFGLAFGPAGVLFSLDPKPPDWVFGVGVGWMFLCLILDLIWILSYPTYFTSLFMLRKTRNALEFRANPAVDLHNPELVFVDIVPRINWGKQMLENATDIGFLEMSESKRALLFEGDRERYFIPVESILEVKHESWAALVQHQLQSAPTLHHHIVVRAQTAAGAWETWFSRRQDTFRRLTAKQRLADAQELESKIRRLIESAR
jgi:hypothetical protein